MFIQFSNHCAHVYSLYVSPRASTLRNRIQRGYTVAKLILTFVRNNVSRLCYGYCETI